MNIICKRGPIPFLKYLRNYSQNRFRAGDIAVIDKKITRTDISEFSRLSGDTNIIHDGENAIVHGAYLNALVSGVIGTTLPGAGTLVVSQNLRFPYKCYIGDTVTVRVELMSIRKIARVQFVCTSRGKIVLEGDAKLILEK